MRGQMLWFDEEVKQLGFIETELGERLCVHREAFAPGEAPEGRCKGMPVVFEVEGEGEERRAIAVAFAEEVAPRRARRRGSSAR
jgi:hypothetical protein